MRCTEGETTDGRVETLKQMCGDQEKIITILEFSEAPVIAVLLSGEVKLGIGSIATMEKLQKSRTNLAGLLNGLQRKQQLPLVTMNGGNAARIIEALLSYEEGAKLYCDICLLVIYASKHADYAKYMPGFSKSTAATTQSKGGLQ